MSGNREISDVDAEFRALIGARVCAYQGQAAWHANKASEALSLHLATGLRWPYVCAVSEQRMAAGRAALAAYWLDILITRSY